MYMSTKGRLYRNSFWVKLAVGVSAGILIIWIGLHASRSSFQEQCVHQTDGAPLRLDGSTHGMTVIHYGDNLFAVNKSYPVFNAAPRDMALHAKRKMVLEKWNFEKMLLDRVPNSDHKVICEIWYYLLTDRREEIIVNIIK